MNDELRSLGSVRTRGILLLVAVAIAGGMAGGAMDRLWMVRHEPVNMRFVEGAPPGWRRTESLQPRGVNEEPRTPEIPYSLRSVNLTDEQKGRIIAIVTRLRPGVDSIMRSLRPRVADLDRRMQQEAMCVLTPRQRDDWVAWRRREHLNMEEASSMMALVTSSSCPAETAARH